MLSRNKNCNHIRDALPIHGINLLLTYRFIMLFLQSLGEIFGRIKCQKNNQLIAEWHLNRVAT